MKSDEIRNYYNQLKPNFLKEELNLGFNDKSLYYYLINNEDNYPILTYIWHKIFTTLCLEKTFHYCDKLLTTDITCKDSLKSFHEDFIKEYVNFNLGNYPTEIQQHIIKQCSPLYRIKGCWLYGVISLKDAGHQYGGLLLKNHAEYVGNGHTQNNHGLLFEQYASSHQISFAPIFSAEFVHDAEINNYAFEFPSFLFSLAHFPTLLLPEILGVNLLMGLMNFPTLLSKNDISSSPFLKKKSETTQALINNAVEAIIAYLNIIPSSSLANTQLRIKQGFAAAAAMYENFYKSLMRSVSDNNVFNVESKVLSIIEKIGCNAYGYHKKGEMDGQPIDEFFKPENFNAKKILNALKRSRYIKPGKPEKSLFLTHIIAPNGPMFRIFSDNDIVVMKEYIQKLEKEASVSIEVPCIDDHLVKQNPRRMSLLHNKNIFCLSRKKYSRCKGSELYYYLLNIDLYPDIYPFAQKIAQKWLNKHRIKLFSGKCPLPFKIYDHNKLDQWLKKQHEKQVASYCPLSGYPEKTREEVIQDAIHLAPLTYIDGAWIRKLLSPSVISTEVGSRLYNIYVDELGNGDPALHHGNIYRSLMKEMKVQLPPFESLEFTKCPYLNEEDFQVPVYWLSISLFPKTFLPEILGLNLAMELSGIGGEYRRSGDILKYYNFSAEFTAIHNTIDNIVTGHTAWSIEAIKLHLDEIFQKGGRDTMQQHWHRIWIGYRSLVFPKGIYVSSMAFFSNLFHKQKVSRPAEI